VGTLGKLIRDIRDRLGVTVLLVEHHMSLVMSVSDKVVALNFGRKIAEGTPAEVQRHAEVVQAYLGNSA
jgi:branched-chain amino acid transport system ATP-binding protein